MPKVSISEEEGMSFETRCKEALTSLKSLWRLFQRLSDEDLRFRQERVRRREEFLAKLDEPTRERIGGLLKDLGSVRTETDEQFYKTMWEEGLQFTREVYGSDATDLALEAIKAGRTKN